MTLAARKDPERSNHSSSNLEHLGLLSSSVPAGMGKPMLAHSEKHPRCTGQPLACPLQKSKATMARDVEYSDTCLILLVQTGLRLAGKSMLPSGEIVRKGTGGGGGRGEMVVIFNPENHWPWKANLKAKCSQGPSGHDSNIEPNC